MELNKDLLNKKKEEQQEFLNLIDKVFNNENGKKLLKILLLKFNQRIDFDNVNKNYYFLGRMDVINYIYSCLKKINKNE